MEKSIIYQIHREVDKQRKTIIIVDPDPGFLEAFYTKLGNQRLKTTHQIYPITNISVMESETEIVDSVLREIKKIYNDNFKIWTVFVDMVIKEFGILDKTGIKIANEIKALYPEIPVFNITARFDSEAEIAMVSEAVVEDIDGVIFKDYLIGPHCSASSIKNIVDKVKSKIDGEWGVEYNKFVDGKVSLIRDRYRYQELDFRVLEQIEEIGEKSYWNLIDKIFPNSEGKINYMRPGRSGAYVFGAYSKFIDVGKSPTLPKNWILKIANDYNMIDKEVTEYKDIEKTPLNKINFPKLYTQKPVIFGRTFGMALELEEDAKSLFEIYRTLEYSNIRRISRDLEGILTNIYGDQVIKTVKLWEDIYNFNENIYISVENHLNEQRNILENVYKSGYDRIYNFIVSKGKSEPKILGISIDIDTRNIHGDFNSRNLLIRNDYNVVIIDFASRRQDHVAKDIAKLERDIIFRVFDNYSLKYHDWKRINTWEKFLRTIEKGNIFKDSYTYNKDMERINITNAFIYNNRRTLKRISPHLGEVEYMVALLHYTILALVHPEISIHKKAFALKYIEKLLDNIASYYE